MIYEIVTSQISGAQYIERYNLDGTRTFIPEDLANADYQEYLKSLDEPSES